MAGFHSCIDGGNIGRHSTVNLLDLTSSSSSNYKTASFHSANARSKNHYDIGSTLANSCSVHCILDAVEKKEAQTMGTGTRWNPAPEQIQALEEMYRCGLHTPTAHQIQDIASQLARFGKIQGKNVFYWFQNHKARERQKLRRELMSAPEEPKYSPTLQQQCCFQTTIPPATALKRTCVEHKSNWSHSTSCSLTHSRESVAYMQRAAVMLNGSKQFGDGETTVGGRHLYWQVVHLSPGHLQYLRPLDFTAPNKITGKEDETEKIKTLQLFPTKKEDCCSEVRDDQPFTDADNKKSTPMKNFHFL